MSWTYNIAALATSPLFQLRLLIGDTLSKDPQFQDEELTWMMTQRSSIYGAASDACRSLSAQMARQADSVQGPLRTAYSTRSRSYAAAAARFELQAMSRSAGMPYSGHTSQIDYDALAADPDRIAGQFAIGMDDSFLPVSPIDTERAT